MIDLLKELDLTLSLLKAYTSLTISSKQPEVVTKLAKRVSELELELINFEQITEEKHGRYKKGLKERGKAKDRSDGAVG